MSARRITAGLAAALATLTLAGCAASTPETMKVGTTGTPVVEGPSIEPEVAEVPEVDDSPTPLPEPTEVPEGGNGTVPRRTDPASVPAEGVIGTDVLGDEWNTSRDDTTISGYDVELCDASLAGTPLAQRTRTLTDTVSHASVVQQVRVYDEAAAERVIGAIRSALESCAGPTVGGEAVTLTEDDDPRFGDESVQFHVQSPRGAEATWLVLRLHEAVSATLISTGDSGDRAGLAATIGDLSVSTLCAATDHGCES